MELLKTQLHQLKVLTIVNLKVRYRKTWIGFAWVLLNPIILLTVQSFVFFHVLKISRQDYLLYLISGFLPWVFFSQSVEMGTNLLKSQAAILKAFSIPPALLVGALILENLVNFLVSIILIYLPLCLFFGFPSELVFPWLVSMLPMFVSVAAIVFLLATWNVLFRDLKYIVSFLLSVSYFITPIFYPLSALPENSRWLMNFNPIAVLIKPFQDSALEISAQDWIQSVLISSALAFILSGLSWFSWKKNKNKFYLNL